MNQKVVLNIEEELKTISFNSVAMKLSWAVTTNNLSTNVLIWNSFWTESLQRGRTSVRANIVEMKPE